MGHWWGLCILIGTLTVGLVSGCDLGWDFLKGQERSARAQTGCQSSKIATGQFPPAGGLLTGGAFTADYSSPAFNGTTSNKALGLRIGRSRLWLHDLSIEVSFFPFDDTDRDPRNGCLGRAILEINIPEERLFFDNRSIDVKSTRISQTESSAFYAEGGDPGLTATALTGTIRLFSIDGSRVKASFNFTFNPGPSQRTFANGEIEDTIDQNPAVEGLQMSP